MKKIICALCLLSFSAFAEEEWKSINSWLNSGFAQAYVTHQDESTKTFQVGIGDSPAGMQIVELRFYDSARDNCITPASYELSDVIIKINGQRVKMKVGCKRLSIAGVLRYFASTKEGNSYLVNTFKKGEPVLINVRGYHIEIPAEGFDVAWKAYGGDAI
jgi:hypothetical protein